MSLRPIHLFRFIIILIINNNKNLLFFRNKKRVSLNGRLKPPYKMKTNDTIKVYTQFNRKKAVHKKNKTDIYQNIACSIRQSFASALLAAF